MYCGKCGNKLIENIKYCGKCGAPVFQKKVEENTLETFSEDKVKYDEPLFKNENREIINTDKNKIALEIVFLVMTMAILAILIISQFTNSII